MKNFVERIFKFLTPQTPGLDRLVVLAGIAHDQLREALKLSQDLQQSSITLSAVNERLLAHMQIMTDALSAIIQARDSFLSIEKKYELICSALEEVMKKITRIIN